MTAPTPYLHFDGDARAALQTWRDVFGGELALHTFGDFGREDGDADRVAHGELHGPVDVSASDTGAGEPAFEATGLLLSLLGAAQPDVLREWFDGLAEGGRVVDPLVRRPWGAWDGRVRDRFGVTWLVGFEEERPD